MTRAHRRRFIGGGLDGLLEELITSILDHSRVWLARCDEVADAVRPALRASA